MNEFPNFSFDTSAVIPDNAVISNDQWKLLRRLEIPSNLIVSWPACKTRTGS